MYDVVVVGNIDIYMFISYNTNNNNILKCCVCSHLSTIVLRWSRSQCNWQMANFYDRTIVCQCSLLYSGLEIAIMGEKPCMFLSHEFLMYVMPLGAYWSNDYTCMSCHWGHIGLMIIHVCHATGGILV